MPAWHNDPASRIEALLLSADRELREAFLNTVRFIRDQRTLAELERMIIAGRLEEALAATTRGFAAFASKYVGVMITTGTNTAGFLGDALGILVSFDQTNVRAVSAMQNNRLRLIREFSESQRSATRSALTDSISRGLGPRQQAIAFRDSIGLTARQEGAVQNFRRMLVDGDSELFSRKLRDRRFDTTIRRAFNADKPLSGSQVDQMTKRYRERFLKHRSVVIARTESLRSVHQGDELMYAQAVEEGTLNQGDIEQFWNTANDADVRDPETGAETSHRTMEGQVQPMGAPFISGAGNLLIHPGDPGAPAEETVQCRCLVTRRFRAPADPVPA